MADIGGELLDTRERVVNGEDTRMVTVWGRPIRVSVRPGDPEATPLLLLMGLGGNVEMWEPFRTQLAQRTGATTVAFDIPGTGDSPAGLSPWPFAALGMLTMRVADAAGLGRFDVLGLSWGGLLAQQVALTHPCRVRRVVLANTNFGLGSLPGNPRAFRVLATPARYTSPDALAQAAAVFGGGSGAGAGEHAAARLAKPPTFRGYYQQILALAGWSSLPALPLLRQPALLLAGDDDPVIPMLNPRLMARLIPRAHLEVVRGGGHLMLFERTAETVEFVAQFLTSSTVARPTAAPRPG
ncbi:alpha/beta fold hydrolase [Streptomyces sp. NPDC046805]|uniref:alpha/beta fold hydrolase n=1 Tax=Streptomyces sp. NPDC046805 TaxID=3155134 RepID=UPI00340FB676